MKYQTLYLWENHLTRRVISSSNVEVGNQLYNLFFVVTPGNNNKFKSSIIKQFLKTQLSQLSSIDEFSAKIM